MMQDLSVTIAHHFFVFALVAALAAELALSGSAMNAAQIRRLGQIDAAYGIIAGLVVVAGVSRLLWGAKGSDYFVQNPVFWAKMATFVAVGLLSVPPTIRILRWRRLSREDPSFVPDAQELRLVRRFMHAQAMLIPLILIFAAAMVRGYGI
ncbi:MAG: DUF2214 family protein [Methylobacteriaceae bacterium]|nr:DUF2214 family protein [Methylobacteriaceae bacterium]MBV9246240.1 DUF2214 family protein [Methylobacteriaceae bacterium]MBV9637731.1 DUF2214 family protein [Methylobacteriaceae bacterium]MBV9701803.1 DUF2214 family protein [Methylobacteriaceae bacterium]